VEEDARQTEKYQLLYQELEKLPKVDGIAPVDILGLPQPLATFLRSLMRKGPMSPEQIAVQLDLTKELAQVLADQLVTKGYLRTEEGEEKLYLVYFARMRKHNVPSDLF